MLNYTMLVCYSRDVISNYSYIIIYRAAKVLSERQDKGLQVSAGSILMLGGFHQMMLSLFSVLSSKEVSAETSVMAERDQPMASPRQNYPEHVKSSRLVTVTAADQNLASSSADLVQRVKSYLLNLQRWKPQQISLYFTYVIFTQHC